MKKFLLAVLVSLGLQTQAQINWCDSISYTTLPQQTLIVIGNSSLSPNMVDSITWSWQACNSTLCYAGSGQTATFPNILSTDTVKVCYVAYIYFMGVNYVCTDCDSLVYDPNSYSWILLNMGNPTAIQEVDLYSKKCLKMFDILGKEVTKVNIGQMYIRNNKKYIRTK